MPTPATDRPRLALVVTAVASVGLAALSVRILDAASVTVAKQVPVNDLRSLTAYLAPLPDSASLAVGAFGSMLGEPDPFGAPAPAGRAEAAGVTPSGSAPAKGSSQQWVVSSILFEDSRRSAIVNDAWVNVGDPLDGGARLAAIERKFVVVTDARGNRLTVPLQGKRHED